MSGAAGSGVGREPRWIRGKDRKKFELESGENFLSMTVENNEENLGGKIFWMLLIPSSGLLKS
ncbi:hypothetical protein [Burkholderia lata]|uniref:hypothetical protein n=1 Tax=Burkholderia lata (strain ATCC 17760 / DSM 23089 / LMG 22485 / NCIMB 9086 / R18194 / 383) TaxID=482957 RepID=UPI00242D039A|nr:hypothetical protein [Burkholderia lata]